MSHTTTRAQHYVCTHQEALELLAAQPQFFLRTCGCRAQNSGQHAENNWCLWFTTSELAEGAYSRAISHADAVQLLEQAGQQGLVVRPFRDFEQRLEVIGICFCCACCCSYFHKVPREACDRGAYVEETTVALCNGCGACILTCLFDARALREGVLQIARAQCYGCGNCVSACPTGAIRMVCRAGLEG